jgi:tripartite-type tricarboxylate transporter receptor subunit TctC
MKPLHFAGACALALTPCAHVLAQGAAYPSRPVTIVVPYSPGAATDALGRAAAQKLTELFGQQVLVTNRDGATGTIGSDFVAKSKPDGYTLLWASSSPISIVPVYSGKTPYDSIRDFQPVTLFSIIPYLLVVHPSVPARNVKELLALAKASPGKMNYATSGAGGALHLAAEMMKSMGGVDIVHIPYRGTSLFMTDLLAGQVDLTFTGIATSAGHIRNGRLRPLAITSRERSPHAPDVPTMHESGLKGYELTNWYGLIAPAGVPRDIIATLHGAMQKALDAPDVRQRIAYEGAVPSGLGPEAFSAHIKAEMARYAKLIEAAKLKPN